MSKEQYQITINKGVRVNDKHYTIDLDHDAICKLQGMLCVAHNNCDWPGDHATDDKAFCRQFDYAIFAARNQGTPA